MATQLEWQGRVGEAWAEKADALDRLLGPVGEAGFEGLPMQGRVLDLGCGAGASSFAMAANGAEVVGIDISADMIAKAKERNSVPGVEFLLADASRYAFETAFDGLYSRCGAMFFDKPIAAWAHLRMQMKSRVPLRIVCWRAGAENQWASVPLQAAAKILGKEKTRLLPSGAPGPFAWAEPANFQPILQKAGWRGIEWRAVDRECVMETGDADDPVQRATDFALKIGPLGSRLKGLAPDIRAAVADEVYRSLRQFEKIGSVMVPTAAWVISAQA